MQRRQERERWLKLQRRQERERRLAEVGVVEGEERGVEQTYWSAPSHC